MNDPLTNRPGGGTSAAASGHGHYTGNGNPNGVVEGDPGDIYIDLDTGIIWPKVSGVGTNTGWGL